MLFSSASPDFLIYGNKISRDTFWLGKSFPESELHRQQLVEFPVMLTFQFFFFCRQPQHPHTNGCSSTRILWKFFLQGVRWAGGKIH